MLGGKMKISELIKELEEFKKLNGDLEIHRSTTSMDRVACNRLELRNIKVLSKRESKPCFWNKYDGDEKKGEAVVAIL
jgi:hypothetical protein